MHLTRLKVPVIVASSIICFAAGAAAAILTMMSFGYSLKEPEGDGSARPMMGMGGPGGPAGGGGGGRGPTAKSQLASLVAKLDQLTRKPLTVSLNEEQRKKVREQLRGLDASEDLTEEDAKKRLEAILDIVQADRESLEAVGYRWPGQRGGGG